MVKKKIISSLTVAGMLGLSVSGAVNAATTNDTTKTDALGVYSNIVEGKKVVPFILQSESDRVTVSDLKAKYPSAVISGEDNTVLKTGDTFTLSGVEHSILIYGDVYADGEVDIFDTMEIIKSIKGQGSLSDIQKAAANVNNNAEKELDIFDIMNVNRVIKGAVPSNQITTAPTGADDEKQEEQKDDTKATGKLENMTVKSVPMNGSSEATEADIASDNVTGYKAKITLEFSANAEGYDYVIHNDTDGEDVKWEKDEVNEQKIILKTTQNIKEKNKNGKIITYSVTVIDENGKQVAKDTFQFREKVSEAVKVTFTDDKYNGIVASNMDNLSLKVEVDTDMDYDATVTVTLADGTREAKGTATLNKNTKIATVNNFKGIADLEDTNTTLNVTVEVKDQYGNISKAYNFDLTEVVNDEVTLVKAKSLKDSKGNDLKITKDSEELKITYANAKRTATDKATVNLLLNQKLETNESLKAYYVVKAVGETAPTRDEILDGKVKVATLSNTGDSAEIEAEIKDGESGKQYVVYIVAEKSNGDQSSVSSATISETGAKQLAKVSGIQKAGEFGKYRWTDTDNQKENPNNIDGYDVILYAVSATDEKAITNVHTATTSVDVSKEIKDFVKDEKNKAYTKYYINVVAKAKNGLVDSKLLETDKVNTDALIYEVKPLTAPEFRIITIGDDKKYADVYADEEKNYNLVLRFNDISESSPNVSMYQIAIYKVDKDGHIEKNATNSVTVPTTAIDDGVDLTGLLFKGQDKGKYAISLKALAFEAGEWIDSEENFTYIDGEEKKNVMVYYVDAPKNLELSVKDENTLKVSVSEITEVYSDDTVKYNVKYREKSQSNNKPWQEPIELSNRSGTVVSTEITHVSEDTQYEAYVVASYNGVEIARTATVSTTTSNAPLQLVNGFKKVVYDNKKIGIGKISNTGDTLLVNYNDNDYRRITKDNGNSNFQEILDIVKALSTDDEIATDETSNAITVTKNVSGGDFGDTLKNANLIINKNGASLKANSVKKVTINDTDVDNNPISKVYLGNVNVGSDGVTLGANVDEIEVSVGTKVKFYVETNNNSNDNSSDNSSAEKTVKINGVFITAMPGTEVTATATNELTIKGSANDEVTIVSDVDKNKTIKFTNSQKTVNVTNARSGNTLTLDGAITTVNVGSEDNAAPSKGIVDVSNVGYSDLNLVNGGAKVAITGSAKDVNVTENVKYTVTPIGTMYVEKTASGLQFSGAGKVEFTVDDDVLETLASEKKVEVSTKTVSILSSESDYVNVKRDSSTVKYEITDKKAYIHLEGNGKATLSYGDPTGEITPTKAN